MSAISVGVDIIEIDRIEHLLKTQGDRFLNKVFSAREIARGEKITNQRQRTAYYAKRFAAKEAYAKAFGFGIGAEMSFKDIEICTGVRGKPFFLKTHDIRYHPLLSLSDSSNLAIAYVTLAKVDL